MSDQQRHSFTKAWDMTDKHQTKPNQKPLASGRDCAAPKKQGFVYGPRTRLWSPRPHHVLSFYDVSAKEEARSQKAGFRLRTRLWSPRPHHVLSFYATNTRLRPLSFVHRVVKALPCIERSCSRGIGKGVSASSSSSLSCTL